MEAAAAPVPSSPASVKAASGQATASETRAAPHGAGVLERTTIYVRERAPLATVAMAAWTLHVWM